MSLFVGQTGAPGCIIFSNTKDTDDEGMRKRIFVLAALAVYLELVFHLYMGLDMRYAPVFLCAAAAYQSTSLSIIISSAFSSFQY